MAGEHRGVIRERTDSAPRTVFGLESKSLKPVTIPIGIQPHMHQLLRDIVYQIQICSLPEKLQSSESQSKESRNNFTICNAIHLLVEELL